VVCSLGRLLLATEWQSGWLHVEGLSWQQQARLWKPVCCVAQVYGQNKSMNPGDRGSWNLFGDIKYVMQQLAW
jgi:hypothetical protein